MPRASPGDGGRNESDVLVLCAFPPRALRASPRKASTLQPVALFEPPLALALATNPPFRTPRLLRASARGRCGARYLHLGRTSLWRFISRGPSDRLAWSRRASSGGKFENKSRCARDCPLAPFLIKNPNLATVTRTCSLSPRSRSILTKSFF